MHRLTDMAISDDLAWLRVILQPVENSETRIVATYDLSAISSMLYELELLTPKAVKLYLHMDCILSAIESIQEQFDIISATADGFVSTLSRVLREHLVDQTIDRDNLAAVTFELIMALATGVVTEALNQFLLREYGGESGISKWANTLGKAFVAIEKTVLTVLFPAFSILICIFDELVGISACQRMLGLDPFQIRSCIATVTTIYSRSHELPKGS